MGAECANDSGLGTCSVRRLLFQTVNAPVIDSVKEISHRKRYRSKSMLSRESEIERLKTRRIARSNTSNESRPGPMIL